MKRSFVAVLATAPVVALALAACGSSSTSNTSSTYPASGAAAASAAATSESAPAGGVAVTVVNAGGKLGDVLAAGPSKLTVYLFEADHGSTSACSGACAQAWPPVTTSGAPTTGAGALSADLATISRPDGSKQVTYKGHPLYFFTGDKGSGEANGEGSKAFGAGWDVLAPSGNKIDQS